MKHLLEQIELSLNYKLYYLSLMAALAVPDIAGALNSDDGKAAREKYIQWFEEYVRTQTAKRIQEKLNRKLPLSPSPLTGSDCYKFRCSLLHQGTSEHLNSSYKKILFIEPGSSPISTHYFGRETSSERLLLIDLNEFCLDVIVGSKEWLDKVEGTEPYESNYKKFIRRYPEGYQPIVLGCPVIG